MKREKKSLQHLIRISTMDKACWKVVCEIQQDHPNMSMTALGFMGNLSPSQSMEILRKVKGKEIHLQDIRKVAKAQPITFH